MLPASAEAIKAIDAAQREIRGRVTIDFVSNAGDRTIQVTASSTYLDSLTPARQAADGRSQVQKPWASIGAARLNGTWYLPTPGTNQELGWSGTLVGDSTGRLGALLTQDPSFINADLKVSPRWIPSVGTAVLGFEDYPYIECGATAGSGYAYLITRTANDRIYISAKVKRKAGDGQIRLSANGAGSYRIRIDSGDWISGNVVTVPDDGQFHIVESEFTATTTGSEYIFISIPTAGSAFYLIDAFAARLEPEILEMTFQSRNIDHITVTGDPHQQSVPKKFDLEYRVNNQWISAGAVDNNYDVDFVYALPTVVSQVTGLRIIIYEVSDAFGRARIVEMDGVLSRTYEGEEVMLMDLSEQMEPDTESILVGGISSSQLRLQVRNKNGEYFAGNPQSSLFGQLRNHRKVRAELGVVLPDGDIEWIPYGPPMYTMGWDTDEIKALTTCRDVLEIMRRATFSTSPLFMNKSVYELFEYLLTEFGMDSSEYWIDPDLKAMQIPYAWWEEMSFRDALRMLAEAATCRIWVSRDGILKIAGYLYYFKERIAEATTSERYAAYTAASQLVDGQKRALRPWMRVGDKPDGTKYPMPTDGTTSVGWWSKQLSRADGTFVTPITITVEFETERAVERWWFYAEELLEEYPVHFKLDYRQGDDLTWKPLIEVTDNTTAEYSYSTDMYYRVTGVRMTIYKVNKPNVHAKLLELDASSRTQSSDAVALLDDDTQIYDARQPVNYEKVINYIDIPVRPRQTGTEQSVYSAGETFYLDESEERTITIYFDSVPVRDVKAPTVSNANVVVVSWIAYCWGVDVTVRNTLANVQSFTIDVKGKPVNELPTSRVVVKNAASIEEMGILRMKDAIDNPFIQDTTVAKTIANNLLKVYADPARDIEADIRGNPLLEVGDPVRITHDPKYINEVGYVVYNDLYYDGALSGKITTRRT